MSRSNDLASLADEATGGITKAEVGLGNVDNTSDANKPVSTAQQTALDAKAPTASPTFTGTVSGVTKAHVGLANVDNESKSTMFSSPTFTGTVSGVTKTHVGLSNVTNDAQVPASGGTFSGNVSFGDNNITNVGDIAVDTISSDAGTSIGVTLGTDAGDDFNVGSGKLVVKGSTGVVEKNDSYFELKDGATTYGYIGKGSDLVTAKNAQDLSIRYGIAGTNNREFHISEQANPRLTLGIGGDCTLHNGSLIIGTAGKGIDFSADSHASKMDSEILDDYETGVLDHPVSFGGQSQGSSNFYSQNSDYTKVGNKVYVNIDYDTYNNTLAAAGPVSLNLPFASNQQIVLYVQAYMNSWSQWVLEVPRTSSTATFYTNSYSAFSLATNQRSIANIFLVYTTG